MIKKQICLNVVFLFSFLIWGLAGICADESKESQQETHIPSAVSAALSKPIIPEAPAQFTSRINVCDFGAKGDGKTDDTESFQKALNSAANNSIGGVVFAPVGIYMIAGNLFVPPYVCLEGIWQAPTSWSQYKGTTLLATAGEGSPNGTPFITLHTNSVIKGLTIFYPNQIIANPPKAYPWTIAGAGGDNSTIENVLIVNPYQAVDFGSNPCGRHVIRNLYAQPLFKGLFIDQCYDVGRIENIHFWPFWTCNNSAMRPVEEFAFNNGVSFIFGRTDWEYVLNTFCFGYKIGYHFIRTKSGLTNGNFLGIGADGSQFPVVIEDCYPYGLLITNGEFVSLGREDSAYITITNTNTGVANFQNCAFWGAPAQLAKIEGRGTIGFNGCNFVNWDFGKYKKYGIECLGGNLLINGCNFNRTGNQIKLGRDVFSAVITGNRFAGKMNINNESKGDVEIGYNTSKKTIKPDSKEIIIDNHDSEPDLCLEGEWNDGWGGDDYHNSCFWAIKGKGETKAVFTPNIMKAGKYRIYIWYGKDPFNNHAKKMPVKINYSGGKDLKHIDLTVNCGEWVLLGEYKFKKGRKGNVIISNDADNHIIADAIKFTAATDEDSKQ